MEFQPDDNQATKIIDQMMDKDFFSQWLGIERIAEGLGFCTLKMKVRKEMLNGFGIVHGGITYSLADSAFAFASNSHGRQSVSIETAISHMVALKEGEVMIAEAKEERVTNKLGFYTIRVTRPDETLIALFRGTVYRTEKTWAI